MSFRLTLLIAILALCLVAVAVWYMTSRAGPSPEEVRKAYATPAPEPGPELRVFHLGHSLVGRDMPAMLAQMAGDKHRYDSQLGWGTSLKEHWEPGEPIKGFDEENDHPRFRPAREAVTSGDYDAVVLTEMVEIRDAIKYHDSGKYFPRWAQAVRDANPETRVFLYESWHNLEAPEGWLTRLDLDLTRYWYDKILLRDLARNAPARPAYVIPAGQVMAELVRTVEEQGGVGNMTTREDLFRRNEDGSLDNIHVNDMGSYVVALTHYAVLYQKSPVGLPHQLQRADGTPADAPTEDLARLMQETVWTVVRQHPETGVPQ